MQQAHEGRINSTPALSEIGGLGVAVRLSRSRPACAVDLCARQNSRTSTSKRSFEVLVPTPRILLPLLMLRKLHIQRPLFAQKLPRRAVQASTAFRRLL